METFFLTLGILTGWYFVFLLSENILKTFGEGEGLFISSFLTFLICLFYIGILLEYFKPAFKIVSNL